MDRKTDDHAYDDIIRLPHPTSRNHPRMSLYDRAAQFAPFAALTGHKAAIGEAGRRTEERHELGDDAIERLNGQLTAIRENLGTRQTVTITYFEPDERKDGGAYVTQSGIVKRMDVYKRTIVMEDGTVIPIDRISEIQGEWE